MRPYSELVEIVHEPMTWGETCSLVTAEHFPASLPAMQRVLENTSERSGWRWVRLTDGTLVLGVVPDADTQGWLERAVADDYWRACAAARGPLEPDVKESGPSEIASS